MPRPVSGHARAERSGTGIRPSASGPSFSAFVLPGVRATRPFFDGNGARTQAVTCTPARERGAARMLVSYGARRRRAARSACQRPGSIDAVGVMLRSRPLSSLVEHFLGKEEVVGPIPTGGSRSPSSGRVPAG